MRTFVNSVRLVAVIAIVVAVVAQWLESSRTPTYSFWNFFGYFTIQSNLIVAVALGVTLVAAARRKRADLAVSVLRGAATVYIATTGIVYNTLLTGVNVSASVPWSNDIVHKIIPVYAVLDWLLFSDRARLLLRHVWWFLLYPAVWTTVVLVRGATDGWVPYPFLAPAQGYGVVAIYVVGIAVSITLLGILVVGMSRLRLVKV
ncbi:Pr6Pr family membrane protein [Curtobacterium sp. VKM Ac-1393]|uniref:Pr6Pr family membrane protein n=1 Tax=Curtobacterium sp. VKM Ac-1393 TaxID=2783814 RepID=UPI00188AE84D|nr:Pr6Pr family membrane protein [Curtobacterium sp. VKM Ac-1393]MBF4608796.1 Pr6Pr family membrane protein [Curtobacterium sp. VKM Ac-1393]